MTGFEAKLRDDMVRLCRSLFDRGYSVGTAGNVSAKLPDGILMTPTNSTLGSLEAGSISKLDQNGNHVSGPRFSDLPFDDRLYRRDACADPAT